MVYDLGGRPVTGVDPLGRRTTTVYDEGGRMVAVIDALGNRTTTVYDAAGQPVAAVDPLGHRSTSVYDAAGRAAAWVDPVGNRNTTVYDLADRPVAGVDGEGRTNVTVVDHVKMVRNRPDLRFEGRIHEQVLPAIRRAGGEVAFTDVFVVHSGADHSPEGRRRKLERDFRLLELDLQERPDHPFVLFNLGMTRADAGQHEEAVESLRRSIEVAQPGESHLRKAYALVTSSLSQLGRSDDALEACREGLDRFPEDAELRFREGVLHQQAGRLEEAEQAYQRVLEGGGPRHFASVDRGLRGFKARHNLALIYEEKGDLDAAEAQWRSVLREQPDYGPGQEGLRQVLRRQGKPEAAEDRPSRLAGRAGPSGRGARRVRVR